MHVLLVMFFPNYLLGIRVLRLQAPTGGVFVQDLTTVTVSNLEEVILVMTKGYKNRAVGSHNVNEHSSRSHLVLSVQVQSCLTSVSVIDSNWHRDVVIYD